MDSPDPSGEAAPTEMWQRAGATYWGALARAEDDCERMRMLSMSPLHSLWVEARNELIRGADEIQRLRARVRELEGQIK